MKRHVKMISLLLFFSNVCFCTVFGARLSKIYIVNNTPLTLKISSFDTTLPEASFVRTSVDTISPWSLKNEIVRFDQNKIKNDEPDSCQIHLSADDKNYVLSAAELVRKKKDEHKELPNTPFRVVSNGVERTVLCHKQVFTKKGGGYDTWFIFSVQPNEQCDDPSGLTVLQWNVWMKPLVAAPHDGHNKRAHLIPGILSETFKKCLPDIVCFNEAFAPISFKKLKKGMRKIGYTYNTAVLGARPFLRFKLSNSGVVVFSRWPITKSKGKHYDRTCLQEDCVADKGCLYTRIEKKGKPYNIFATHIQSGAITMVHKARKNLKKAEAAGQKEAVKKARNILQKAEEKKKYYQGKQFAIIRKFIDAQNIDKNEPILIVGDLNVNRADFDARVSKILNATLPEVMYQYGGYTSTTHAVHGSHIDYLIYSNTHRKPKRAYNKILHPTLTKAWVTSAEHKRYGDTLMWWAADHKPVLGYFKF